MKLDEFVLENWLNPAANSEKNKVYLGGSCVLPMTVEELFELTGESMDDFFEELKKMNLGYGFFAGTPRLREAVSKLYKTVTPETVVQLVRKNPDTYIDITVDMDELDLTTSEAKATYDEIKDYIFDKHRVKVSSLYVAQVKQKHGIIERDCYNNSKKDNQKQPQCPPEKVKLIEEALRHFKMIS